MPELVLAIDLGSSWCKAAYIDCGGQVAAEGRAFTRNIPPTRDNMLEQFWATVVSAVRAANAKLPDSPRPTAIAHTCRAQFGVCLDHNKRPFFPAFDAVLTRTTPEVQYAYSPAVWGDQDPFAFGYGVRQAATALWLRRERPHEWRRISRIGALHDFIVYQMTHTWVTDPTSGPGPDGWPDELIQLSGLPPDAFPCTLQPETIAGSLIHSAANDLGLQQGTPVVVGMHDGAAANLGVRAIDAGDACLTLGTNFVFRAATGSRLTTGCFSYVVAPNRWAWVNNVPIASTQLDIVAEMLQGTATDLQESHHMLGAQALQVPPGVQGLLINRVLPQQEERLRQQVQRACTNGFAPGEIYRALVEAIAYGVHDLVGSAMRCGVEPKRFVATGGSAHNRAFLRVLSSVLDTSIEVGIPESGLIGAGIVAALASQWFDDLDAALAAMTAQYPVIYADTDAVRYYKGVVEHRH